MRASARRALAILPLALSACGQELPGGIILPDVNRQLGLSQDDADAGAERITPDATIPIRLTSNKDNTAFTVNGQPLNAAKSIRVIVPRARLVITAKAPCYRMLTQTAEPDSFGRGSEFVFAMANWDRLPNTQRAAC